MKIVGFTRFNWHQKTRPWQCVNVNRLFAFAVFFWCSFSANANTYTIRLIDDPQRSTNIYIEMLVAKSFQSIGHEVNIEYIRQKVNQKRIIELLSADNQINLAWLATNDELESKLRPIKVPLYKGVHGKRVLLVHKSVLKDISAVDSLDALKPFVGLQYQGWEDYKILQYNGLKVDGRLDYIEMFKAIDHNLGDYYPRSAYTINGETKRFPSDNVVIEPNILLEYPFYLYFFTNKKYEEMASQLEKGLLAIQSSGEFDRLFHNQTKGRLEGLNLDARRVFHLKVPPARSPQ